MHTIIQLVSSNSSYFIFKILFLAAVALDKTGTKVATASDKGTVIRIFAVPSGKTQIKSDLTLE